MLKREAFYWKKTLFAAESSILRQWNLLHISDTLMYTHLHEDCDG